VRFLKSINEQYNEKLKWDKCPILILQRYKKEFPVFGVEDFNINNVDKILYH
jgi:hypothetical protein